MGWLGKILNEDGYDYLQIAGNLLEGSGFAFAPDQPTAFRPYGYPWLIAGIFTLFGHSVAAIQGVQCVLSGIGVAWLYLWTDRLVGTVPASLTALAATFHPVLLYLPVLLAPETASLWAMIALLWFAWQITTDDVSWLSGVGMGVAGILAIWMRPELLLLVGLLPFAYLIQERKWNVPAKTLLLTTLLAILLALLPVAIRNKHAIGSATPMPTVGGVTFWGANNAHANGGWVQPLPIYWTEPSPPPDNMRGWVGLTEIESQTRFYQAAFQWIYNHPQEALALLPAKLGRSWSLSYGDIDKPSPLPVYMEWLHKLLGLWATAGIFLLLRHRSPLLWILLTPILVWLAKTLLFYGSARQTALVLPIFSLLATLFLCHIAQKFPARWHPPSSLDTTEHTKQ